jgi:hypothetical protein
MTGRGAGSGGRRWVTTDERPQQRGRHQPDRCCAPPVAAVEAHDRHPSRPVWKERSLTQRHVLEFVLELQPTTQPSEIPVTTKNQSHDEQPDEACDEEGQHGQNGSDSEQRNDRPTGTTAEPPL